MLTTRRYRCAHSYSAPVYYHAGRYYDARCDEPLPAEAGRALLGAAGRDAREVVIEYEADVATERATRTTPRSDEIDLRLAVVRVLRMSGPDVTLTGEPARAVADAFAIAGVESAYEALAEGRL